MSTSTTLTLLSLPLLAVGAAACAFVPEAPLRMTTPALTFNVDDARTALEAAICADPSSERCSVLQALDVTDGVGQVPPALPLQMPCEIVAGRTNVEVAAWIEKQRQLHDIVPSFSVPIDIGGMKVGSGSLGGASIGDAAVLFEDDVLEMDLPVLRIDVLKNGETLPVGVVEAHRGRTNGRAAISLADGGADRLLSVIEDGGADVVVGAELSQPLGLHSAADGTLLRPGGSTKISLFIELDVETAGVPSAGSVSSQ